MIRETQTEVLVVGAGPAGLMTALLLAEDGVDVRIIDQAWRTATHSYACVLHPATLKLLDRLGLAQDVIAQGRRIDSIAFYEGTARRAELLLANLGGAFPFAVVLPQSAFESLLEQRLLRHRQIKVEWNHRLAELINGDVNAVASVDRLGQTAKGYIVPDWDWVVEETSRCRAAFVVGADGHNSLVRSKLGLEYESAGQPASFVVFEFDTETDPGSEMRVALDNGSTNVLWPLPGRRARWSFQLVQSQPGQEFPGKDREAVRIVQEAADRDTLRFMQRLAAERAPWFKEPVKEVYWSIRIQFQQRLARQFGQGRVWLVGDAAHQTGPVGVQSMNAGLGEAADLTAQLKNILHARGSMDLLDRYQLQHRSLWQKQLGLTGGPVAQNGANAWVKDHWTKILPCLPACGADLTALASQVGLGF